MTPREKRLIEGQEAEAHLKSAIAALNRLRIISEVVSFRTDSGRSVMVCLKDRLNDQGWEWSIFLLSGEDYSITAEICGAPGELSCETHYPALAISGHIEAALSDLRLICSQAERQGKESGLTRGDL